MPASRLSARISRPSLSFMLLMAFLALLLLAGGASRPDVLGQAIVRGGAWAALLICALFTRHDAAVAMSAPGRILLAALALALLQLIPLPPDWWRTFAARGELAEISGLVDAPLWQPWATSPGAAINAAASLIIPIAVLLLMARLRDEEGRWLPTILIVLSGLSLLAGLLQFSGAGLGNPFVNDTPGEVGGFFANRNHFALFLAITCVTAPVWAFSHPNWSRRLAPIALGIVALSALTILATGSRAGLLLGGGALVLALLLAGRDLRRVLRGRSRWMFPAVIGGVVVVVATFLLFSVAADRAVSVDRLLATEVGQDMRSRGLPIVLKAIATYFPMGFGLGGFDPVFRLHEPFALLKPTYFNHAHNDFLEVMLDAGVAGSALLAVGLFWWFWASVQAWRYGDRLARLGSAILLLVIVASLSDYPARTPLIMAISTIAAVWLSNRQKRGDGFALPRTA